MFSRVLYLSEKFENINLFIHILGSNLSAGGGGGGGINKVLYGRLQPVAKPLTLLYTIIFWLKMYLISIIIPSSLLLN